MRATACTNGYIQLELELELIQTQIALNPTLREKVQARLRYDTEVHDYIRFWRKYRIPSKFAGFNSTGSIAMKIRIMQLIISARVYMV